ncbi:MAG: ABC transporter permease [Chloroflexi bacterium]|nr:MAG: ABC transporter permease [Chloroflexota bacterium]
MDQIRLFIELTKKALQRQMTYRAAIAAGVLTNLFFGLLRAAVLQALYVGRSEVAGITLPAAITYTGISQATIGIFAAFSWFAIIRSVYSGEVSSDLLKPMDYFTFWLAQDWGRSIIELLLRSLPIMLAYAVVFGITVPHTAVQWLALAAALWLGWLVSFAWRFLLNLSAFWTPNAIGVARFGFVLSWFMSGFLMPLRFFPDWFVQICYLTPFPHTVNTVVEIYLGLLSGPEILMALGGQALWAAVLIAAGQLVLQLGIRKLVIQGG